jgi:hypothetical protein
MRHVFRPHVASASPDLASWLETPWPRNMLCGPAVPAGFIVRPEFRCGPASFLGTYGFILAHDSSGLVILLTALHVLDELAKSHGIDCTIATPSRTECKLARLVDQVTMYDGLANKWWFEELGFARSMFVLPEARIGEEEPFCQNDIAAFNVEPSCLMAPGTLATHVPSLGEPVWLAANCYSADCKIYKPIEAVIVESTTCSLVYRFSSTAVLPQYTSGAPVINASGEIVGISAGAGAIHSHCFGHAIHVASIRNHLSNVII